MKGQVTDIWEWFSIDWFYPSMFKSFVWETPNFLYLIPFVPLLFVLRWIIYIKFRQKLEFAFLKRQAKSSPITLLRFIPDAFFCLFISMIFISLARPQKTNEQVEFYSEGIDIMLCLDISESMLIEDFKPNRLEAAKKVATKFIKGRFQDRIGLVVFAGDAFSMCPLTTDYELLYAYLDDVKHDLIQKPGTAIGSAIAVATNRMLESKSKTKVMIVISDGENTAGNIEPITATKLAIAYNIKIYTIGVGQDGRVPYGKDMFGNTQYVENMMNESTLRQIAGIASGRYNRASSNNALQQIFSQIDKYEKAEIKETRFKDTRDFYFIYLTWGLFFFLVWMLLKNTFMTSALED
jgi:Ca-activated chloride channel family protein